VSLDPPLSDAELLRRFTERQRPVIVPGPNSVLHQLPARPPAKRASRDAGAVIAGRQKKAEREHAIQVQVIDWAKSEAMLARFPELDGLYAIPNGGGRSAREGQALKDEGVVAGTMDLCLPTPRCNPDAEGPRVYGACYLELKDLEGRLNAAQLARIPVLRACGNYVDVAMSFEASRALMLYYLALPRP
jgi:hypothetical protein